MYQSDSIGKLAQSLSKFQGEVTDAAKDKKGYGYNYADLAGVLEIARPLLLKYELAVSQLCVTSPDMPTHIGVETVLMHSSGEYISNAMYMPVEPKKGLSMAQCSGVVITYCRRYALAAILGITQVDDDARDVAPMPVKAERPRTDYEVMGGTLREHVFAVIKARNTTREECNAWLAKYNVEKLSQLTDAQLAEISREIDNG